MAMLLSLLCLGQFELVLFPLGDFRQRRLRLHQLPPPRHRGCYRRQRPALLPERHLRHQLAEYLRLRYHLASLQLARPRGVATDQQKPHRSQTSEIVLGNTIKLETRGFHLAACKNRPPDMWGTEPGETSLSLVTRSSTKVTDNYIGTCCFGFDFNHAPFPIKLEARGFRLAPLARCQARLRSQSA